jgi:phospholipase D1/2
VLVQGPLAGAATALLAGTLIGLASFGAGAWLGREAVTQWAGPRVQAIHALVARRGLLAVFVVRLVPAAPYAVVNLLLGTTPLGWQVFLLGNLLGMLPMVGITALLAPEILAQLQQPSEAGWAALAAVLLLIAVASWLLKRWARRL